MSDELKQNEKNGNFVQFYRDNMQAISKLAGKKILRLFKSLCLFASTWTDITLSWLHIGFLKTIRVNLLGQLLGA